MIQFNISQNSAWNCNWNQMKSSDRAKLSNNALLKSLFYGHSGAYVERIVPNMNMIFCEFTHYTHAMNILIELRFRMAIPGQWSECQAIIVGILLSVRHFNTIFRNKKKTFNLAQNIAKEIASAIPWFSDSPLPSASFLLPHFSVLFFLLNELRTKQYIVCFMLW